MIPLLAAGINHWQKPTPEYNEYPISKELLGRYYDVVDTPEEADFAIVSIRTPFGHWGYVKPEEGQSEGHYQPISPYTAVEPYGLLPCQLPADMKTVEEQCEDVPRDMRCYTDSEGNTYDFAYGLNWRGRIMDRRVKKYQNYEYE